MSEMGRPSGFTEENKQRIITLARTGATDKMIADDIGVHPDTVNRWKNSDPDFYVTIKEIKYKFDTEKVVSTLLKSAMGFYRKKKFEIDEDGNEVNIEWEEVSPNATAQIFWLKNRQPQDWRDVKDSNLTVKDETVEQFIARTMKKNEKPLP